MDDLNTPHLALTTAYLDISVGRQTDLSPLSHDTHTTRTRQPKSAAHTMVQIMPYYLPMQYLVGAWILRA